MKIPTIFGLTAAFTVAASQAEPRSSANYEVPTDSIDSGGQQTSSTSSNYSHDGSLGGITGISTVAVPAEINKAGYLGQLYDIVGGLELSSVFSTVDEASSIQLVAAQFLDDDTTLAMDPTLVTWGVVSGPLSGIDAAGLATSEIVYEDTAATVQGTFGGDTDDLDLTVIDSDIDNFGLYAGDNICDAWQVLHFGLENPDAAPFLDPDGDGQNNFFEAIAGLVPTDAQSRFILTIETVPGQPNDKKLIFEPTVSGRVYTVLSNTNPAIEAWAPLSGETITDDGPERTVTDHGTSELKKLYTVEIEYP